VPGPRSSSPRPRAACLRRTRAWAAVVHGPIERLELDRPLLPGHDIGRVIAHPYLCRYQDVAGVVIVDVVNSGLDSWDEVTCNPYL
jgi:pimeloyl-ACP methyl ester carboxylesterase